MEANIKELNAQLDHEEITNLQYIEELGKTETYKEWCEVLGYKVGDEEKAEEFVNELRYGEEGDDDQSDELWGKVQEQMEDLLKDLEEDFEHNSLSSVEIFEKWRKDKNLLAQLKTSDNAVKVTLWRYKNSGGYGTCENAINISKNTVIKWWCVSDFINGALAGGGHIHLVRVDYDNVKKLLLDAVEKAEGVNNE